MIEKTILLIKKLLGSLYYQIEKELTESVYKNETYLKNKWNTFESLIIYWTKKPFSLIFIFFVEFCSISLLIYLLNPFIKKTSFTWNQSWEQIIDWQSNFLSTQVTIVALIFPLVIGFIGFFIQNISSQRALWQIYMNYSGVKLVGYSSIVLCIIIVTLQLIHPFISYQLEVSFSIGIVFWLVINLLLLIWFIHATFNFISTKDRSKIILKYCINEMFINEIKYRLAKLLPQRIFENEKDEDKNPIIYPAYPFSEKHQDTYQINFKEDKYVHDIYFKVLKLIGYIWKLRNDNYKGEQPILYLPISGVVKGKVYSLAYSDNTNINFLEKFLIRISYSFSKNSRFEQSEFDSIIHALISNVEDSLKEQDERLFEIAIKELAYLVVQIFKTASFPSTDNELNNWILLSDGNFFGRTIIQNLSSEFYKINKKSIDLLSYSDIYFRKMCYFNLKVFGFKNDVLASKVIEELLQNHYYSWSLLMKKINNLENNEEYLKTYIGSWEFWIASSKFNLKKEKNIDYLTDVYLSHLQVSSKHIIDALNVNNEKAILLSVDMLIYWSYQAFHMFNKSRNEYKWQSKILVPSVLKNNFNSEYINKEKLYEYIFPNNSKDDKTALVVSFENLWKQTCIITGIYIFYKYKEIFSDNIKKVVLSLLKQERIYDNNMTILLQSNKQIDVSSIFECYLFNVYPLRDILKSGNPAYLIELFECLSKESMISNRVHTDRSIELSSLLQTIKCFMIGNSTRIWNLSKELNDFIKSPLFEYEARESFIREINSFKYLENIDDKLFDDVNLLFSDENIEQKVENYKTSIDAIIKDITDYHNEVLVNTSIDNQKVDEMNRYFSNEIFNDLDYMPYSLFNNIKFDSLEQKFFKKIKINIDKKFLVKDINFIDINKYFEHENKYIISDIRQEIVSSIFDKFLTEINIKEEQSFDNIENLLNKTIDDAQKLIKKDFVPIVFVCSNEIKWMLENETYDKQFKDILIEKLDNKEENYICHIDNIEAYELSVNDGDYLILTSLEMFDEVIFNEYEKNIYSKIEILNSEREFEKIVSFNYRMKINFKKVNSYKYNFKDKTNTQVF
ncbi:hypothetical protein [Halarcobacter sp.]|uniref:hypothetical protein n=1 Tax=Halarcobacter sp. TaxID=2321133 RepID=UPI002AA6F9E5|nr:hypothetical protein [Halarcobacter sp.]